MGSIRGALTISSTKAKLREQSVSLKRENFREDIGHYGVGFKVYPMYPPTRARMDPIIIRSIVPHAPKTRPRTPNIRTRILPLRRESESPFLMKKEPISTSILDISPRKEIIIIVVPAPLAPHTENDAPHMEPRNATNRPEISIRIPPMRETMNAPVESPVIHFPLA